MIDDNTNEAASEQREQASSTNRKVSFVAPGESVPDALITAVASFKQVDALELPPLYETVDPDAVETLIESQGDGTTRSSGVTVFFNYGGCEVRLTSNGFITLAPTSEG